MITQDIEIKASPKKCFDVIADYEKYPEFISDLKKVEVKGRRGGACEITYHIHVIKDITYTLKMNEKAPSKIEWSFVKGDFMKDNLGFWDLKEVKKGITKATYNIDVKFGLFVPGAVTKILVGKNLPEMLGAFKKRIEEM